MSEAAAEWRIKAGSDDEPILQVENVAHAFGGVQAVNGVTLSVAAGRFVGLIGPNGAGKTTLLDCISGALNTYRGKIRFAGTDVSNWEMSRIANRGLIRTFQTSRVFGRMTILSNVMAGPQRLPGEGLLAALLGRGMLEEDRALDEAHALLRRFELTGVQQNYGADVSGGQRRLTELCRALTAHPRMLALDEPFAGVSPTNRARLGDQLRRLCRDDGIPIVMIEHRLEMVEQLCDQIYVMAEGRIIAEGTMSDLRRNSAVVSAYLGDVVAHGA